MEERLQTINRIIARIIVDIVVPIAFWIVVSAFAALLWNWIIPDIFRGLVSKGVLPAHLNILEGFKIVLALVVLDIIVARRLEVVARTRRLYIFIFATIEIVIRRLVEGIRSLAPQD